jgi:valyl-tRNA synthetase
LKTTTELINKELENFEFGPAAHTIYDFFWHDFCDIYIEENKKYDNNESKKVLYYALKESLKLLHPFIPFITEEIYQNLPQNNKFKSLMVEDWPK